METINENAVYILLNKRLLIDCNDIVSLQRLYDTADMYAVKMTNGEMWQAMIDEESVEKYNDFVTKRSEEKKGWCIICPLDT